MKTQTSNDTKSKFESLNNQPITTTDPQLVTWTATTSLKENGRLESFTFDRQKKLFNYIKIIGCYIDKNIPSFRDIWPFLGRYTEEGHWHPKLDINLEFIGTAHYTVLKSLCFIIRNKDMVAPNDPDQRYKNVIFHYAIINDCIKELCCHLLKFEKKLDSTLSRQIRQLNYIVSLNNSIRLPNNEQQFITFNDFKKNRIDPLRNAFIHNPSIDIFWRGHTMFVVRPEVY